MSPSTENPSDRAAYNDASAQAKQADENGRHAWDALRDSAHNLNEIREYVSYLVQARMDAWKATLRSLLIYAAAGIVALVVALTFVVMSSVLLFLGLAIAVGKAIGILWLGYIIVSAGFLLIIAVGLMVALKKFPAILRRQLVSKYEQRQRQQRTEFGHDVTQQAHVARERDPRLRREAGRHN